MKKPSAGFADTLGFCLSPVLLVALSGCVTDSSPPPSAYRGRPAVQVQAAVSFHDDYDYYPGYEVYYSRNRREYVYRDGNAWVRRPEPRGVTAAILFSSPNVRVDFHDSPEQHHSNVVRTYPRNWAPPGARREEPAPRHDDRREAPRPVARSVPPPPPTVVVVDDYDYYPGYEVYYSRTRREYVYRDGNAWVLRPEPRGVKLNVLLAAPSVRVDFRDSPEQHHSAVQKKYPKNWKHSEKDRDDKDVRKDDKDDEKRDRKDDDQRK